MRPSKIEALDLPRLEKPVLAVGARRQQHRRPLGMRFVGDGVRREVQDVVVAEIAVLQLPFGGAPADERIDTAEVSFDRAALAPRIRKAAEAQTFLQHGVAFGRRLSPFAASSGSANASARRCPGAARSGASAARASPTADFHLVAAGQHGASGPGLSASNGSRCSGPSGTRINRSIPPEARLRASARTSS